MPKATKHPRLRSHCWRTAYATRKAAAQTGDLFTSASNPAHRAESA